MFLHSVAFMLFAFSEQRWCDIFVWPHSYFLIKSTTEINVTRARIHTSNQCVYGTTKASCSFLVYFLIIFFGLFFSFVWEICVVCLFAARLVNKSSRGRIHSVAIWKGETSFITHHTRGKTFSSDSFRFSACNIIPSHGFICTDALVHV